jgi:hypothetical protein
MADALSQPVAVKPALAAFEGEDAILVDYVDYHYQALPLGDTICFSIHPIPEKSWKITWAT